MRGALVHCRLSHHHLFLAPTAPDWAAPNTPGGSFELLGQLHILLSRADAICCGLGLVVMKGKTACHPDPE